MNGVAVKGLPAGSAYRNVCGGSTGHGIPSPDPVTVPGGGGLLVLEVATGPVREITATVYAGETPTSEARMVSFPPRSPLAALHGIAPGTYYISVRVDWDGLLESGTETYAFRIIVRDP